MTSSLEPPTELHTVSQTLAALQASIAAFDSALHDKDDDVLYRPPIIDQSSSDEYVQAELEGWRKYVGQVQAEKDWVDGLLASPDPPSELATSNTSHLVTMFNSISSAPRPIVCINHHFAFPSASTPVNGGNKGPASGQKKGRGGKDEAGSKMIKVDVVGRGGKEWIRTNTIKLQKLMSEFHEQDSYLNSDFDSSSSSSSPSASSSRARSPPVREPLQNSVLTTAQNLLAAAAHQPRPKGFPIPTITYRLTRLWPEHEHPYPDERVGETFELIRSWGINLVFGDGSNEPIRGARRVQTLEPTLRINLDLSVIIALVSDITHYPLPASVEEARRRFLRPVELAAADDAMPHGGNPCAKLHPDTTSGAGLVKNPGLHSKHTRNLVLQITQEMERGIVDEINQVLSRLLESHPPGTAIEFWCTQGARRGLEEIVRVNQVVGDGHEQRRSRALFSDDGDPGAFWRDSRHQGSEGVLKDFRIHVFDTDTPTGPLAPRTAFMDRLAHVCVSLNDSTKHKVAQPAIGEQLDTSQSQQANPRNPSLVTLDSLRRGAQHGMTTLTNNRMSVKQLLRSMRKWDAWTPGDYDDLQGAHTAAVWVMEARSLAEWTRIKFAAGNYSKGGQDGLGHRWPRVSQYVKMVENGEHDVEP